MFYKIKGETGSGHASCGHVIKAGEEYFIKTEGKNTLLAVCEKCAGNPKSYNTIKVPQDLVDGCIPIR